MIISITAQKGGVGKTTLASNLAQLLDGRINPKTKERYKVAIVDADPQGTLSLWLKDRKENNPENTIEIIEFNIIDDVLKKADVLNEIFDFVIIDTPPSVNNSIGKIIAVSDICVIPTKIGAGDLRAVSSTLALMNDKRFCFVISEASGQNLLEEAIRITSNKAPLLSIIPSKVVYKEAMALGQGVSERKRYEPSLSQLNNLIDFILGNPAVHLTLKNYKLPFSKSEKIAA